jgi:Tol biopolymer transport system component
MNPDGTDQTQLTETDNAQYSPQDTNPAWSPDGTQMTFTSFFSQSDVYTLDADGSDKTNRTNDETKGFDGRPDWQPSGG